MIDDLTRHLSAVRAALEAAGRIEPGSLKLGDGNIQGTKWDYVIPAYKLIQAAPSIQYLVDQVESDRALLEECERTISGIIESDASVFELKSTLSRIRARLKAKERTDG